MRSRTAAVLCFVLLGVMFGLPAAVRALILPSLEHDLTSPIPAYEQILLEIALFCGHWKWLLLVPVGGLGLFFTIVELTRSPQARK